MIGSVMMTTTMTTDMMMVAALPASEQLSGDACLGN